MNTAHASSYRFDIKRLMEVGVHRDIDSPAVRAKRRPRFIDAACQKNNVPCRPAEKGLPDKGL